MPSFSLKSLHFDLPKELIAQQPCSPRDASLLMHVQRQGSLRQQRRFRDIVDLLHPGDVLVVNATKVVPARAAVQRQTGAQMELLIERPVGDAPWQSAQRFTALARNSARCKAGETLYWPAADLHLRLVAKRDMVVEIESDGPLLPHLLAYGHMPLPPYINDPQRDSAADSHNYQTLFAQEVGAVAAPTASLHFTPRVVAALAERGVQLQQLVLHVGLGTFLPIRPEHVEDVAGHTMHGEYYSIPPATRAAVTATKDAGGRVIAVGTTVMRALETWAHSGQAGGDTDLFIYPGFEFKCVDGLLTNFHLPNSTLMLLVAAFGGVEQIRAAYQEAVAARFRFYSYGDAMLIL